MFEKLVVSNLLGKIKTGELDLSFWDGEKVRFGQGTPQVSLVIKKPQVVRSILLHPSIGFGEAYMKKSIEIQGSLDNLFLIINQNSLLNNYFLNYIRLPIHADKVKQSKQVQYHYDKGNEFYKLWLDKSLTYSCAYFKNPQDSLEKAQQQKVEHLLKKLYLQKGMTLLDIGCGWGNLVIQAAKKYGVFATGITVSKEQFKFATARIKKEGLENRVKIKLMHYHDLESYNEQFDRIISVGMFEHVGKENYPKYFQTVHNKLKDQGLSVLHTISQSRELPAEPWVNKYIFPGGYIPSIREIIGFLPDYNFQLIDYENLRLHYAKTLGHWFKRYTKHQQKIIEMYGDEFYRMWEFWLIASQSAFRDGNLHLSQVIFTKGTNNNLPWTREFIYK